jgi:hypothetical protein
MNINGMLGRNVPPADGGGISQDGNPGLVSRANMGAATIASMSCVQEFCLVIGTDGKAYSHGGSS